MSFYNQELQNIGKIIALGGLELSLNLKLDKRDIQALNIDLRNIKSLQDLLFLIDNENIWEKIYLSTKNELINTLFHMNRVKKIKNIVAYLIYDKIEFTEEQKKFQKILDFALLNNGVVIYSYPICKCKINIGFNLIYKNNTIKINLYGEKEENSEINTDNKNNKEECKNIDEINSKENDDDFGLFSKIPEAQVNFDDFKYLYIHFSEYNYGGEFYQCFKIREIYNYVKYIKNNFKIKIIFNFCENFRKSEKYLIELIKIVDIHIFRNKSDLLDLLIKKKESDDLKYQKNTQKLIENIKSKKLRIKFLKRKLKDTKSNSVSNLNKIKIHKNAREKFDTKEEKSQSLKNILIRKSINITLNQKNKAYFNKHNMFDYIHDLIYNSSDSSTYYSTHSDKLGIYLDNFKKIYIVNYKMFKTLPDIKEYDFNIYPKSNIYNLKEIQGIRKILFANYSLFSYIIYGCILSNILDGISKKFENYYLFYLYIRLSILKILSVIKNGMKIPTNKDFYIIDLKKEELDKIISDETHKEREKGFINDYSNRESDYRLTKKSNFFHLKNDKFGILFKQSFHMNNSFYGGNSTMHAKKKNNKIISNLFSDKITKNINISPFSKTIWTKKHNDKFSMIRNRLLDNCSIFLAKELRKDLTGGKILPLIKKNKNKSKNNTTHNFFNSNITLFNIRDKSEEKKIEKETKEKIIEKQETIDKEKIKDNEKIKETREKAKEKLKEEIKDKIKFTNRFFEYKRIDTSKYKEIKFQPTQPEKE